jgi:hypothetical protein
VRPGGDEVTSAELAATIRVPFRGSRTFVAEGRLAPVRAHLAMPLHARPRTAPRGAPDRNEPAAPDARPDSSAQSIDDEVDTMKATASWSLSIGAVLVAVAILYYWISRSTPEAPTAPPLPEVVEPPPPSAVQPSILYPVPSTPAEEEARVPALKDSDPLLEQELRASRNGPSLAEVVLFDDLIRRFVATVDNLPRKSAPQRMLPVKNVRGQFLVSRGADGIEVMRQNSARYAAHVRIAQALDTAQAVGLYVRFYPLLQQAYRELGYPNGHFNDRMVAVIDDLLAAPDVQGPLRLVQPKVMYQFADPALEERSAGQKILIRMGSENAARIKAKLREIRAALVSISVDRPR